MDDLITVITPTFNCEKYIEQCIKSVINQKNVKTEHIVIDGLSTDNTLNIVKKYKNIKFISEQDSGEVDALNKGLKLAKGNYICWLNADDWLEPDVLQLIKNLDDNSHILYGNTNVLNNKDEIFTLMQGEVYGKRILEASPAPNILLSLNIKYAL